MLAMRLMTCRKERLGGGAGLFCVCWGQGVRPASGTTRAGANGYSSIAPGRQSTPPACLCLRAGGMLVRFLKIRALALGVADNLMRLISIANILPKGLYVENAVKVSHQPSQLTNPSRRLNPNLGTSPRSCTLLHGVWHREGGSR